MSFYNDPLLVKRRLFPGFAAGFAGIVMISAPRRFAHAIQLRQAQIA
jgi:hypothetical protein